MSKNMVVIPETGFTLPGKTASVTVDLAIKARTEDMVYFLSPGERCEEATTHFLGVANQIPLGSKISRALTVATLAEVLTYVDVHAVLVVVTHLTGGQKRVEEYVQQELVALRPAINWQVCSVVVLHSEKRLKQLTLQLPPGFSPSIATVYFGEKRVVEVLPEIRQRLGL
jgi:hypothetical protein